MLVVFVFGWVDGAYMGWGLFGWALLGGMVNFFFVGVGLGANVVIFVGLWGGLGVKKSTSGGVGVLCGWCVYVCG